MMRLKYAWIARTVIFVLITNIVFLLTLIYAGNSFDNPHGTFKVPNYIFHENSAWEKGTYRSLEVNPIRAEDTENSIRWFGVHEGFSRQFLAFSCMVYSAELTERSLLLGKQHQKQLKKIRQVSCIYIFYP